MTFVATTYQFGLAAFMRSIEFSLSVSPGEILGLIGRTARQDDLHKRISGASRVDVECDLGRRAIGRTRAARNHPARCSPDVPECIALHDLTVLDIVSSVRRRVVRRGGCLSDLEQRARSREQVDRDRPASAASDRHRKPAASELSYGLRKAVDLARALAAPKLHYYSMNRWRA